MRPGVRRGGVGHGAGEIVAAGAAAADRVRDDPRGSAGAARPVVGTIRARSTKLSSYKLPTLNHGAAWGRVPWCFPVTHIRLPGRYRGAMQSHRFLQPAARSRHRLGRSGAGDHLAGHRRDRDRLRTRSQAAAAGRATGSFRVRRLIGGVASAPTMNAAEREHWQSHLNAAQFGKKRMATRHRPCCGCGPHRRHRRVSPCTQRAQCARSRYRLLDRQRDAGPVCQPIPTPGI